MDETSLKSLGNIIDRACDNSDEEELSVIIATQQYYVETLSDSITKATLYYYLANCWSGLKDIEYQKNKKYIWNYEQKELFKEIYYLRKAISENEFENSVLGLKVSIFTNLANSFSRYGRTIIALKYFNKALEIVPNHFMALTNKAICLESYAKLDYDDGHQIVFLKSTYACYHKALEEINSHLDASEYDKKYYEKIHHDIKLSIKRIEQMLPQECLDEGLNFDKFSLGKTKKEEIFRRWVLSNKLFLNPMNDLDNFSIAAYDPLNLPTLTVPINLGFPKYITYFNQIKQEFIINRVLLYEGLNQLTIDFYEHKTSLIQDYDYNIYDLNIEKVKLSFRGFYALFDKIACFINEYFNLGMEENRVDFRKVWKKGKQLNPKFNQFENPALRGLYLLSKDLFFTSDEEKYEEVLEPESKKINKIRNHLEHKFIMIKAFNIDDNLEKRERNFYITEAELYEKTINLAQLAREAIIYLSFAVHHEERKKDSSEIYFGEDCEVIK